MCPIGVAEATPAATRDRKHRAVARRPVLRYLRGVLLPVMPALLLVLAARAGDPAPSPAEDSDTSAATEGALAAATAEIEAARQLYASGQASAARDLLQAVVARGRELTPELRQRALAFLGDLLFSEDSARAADPYFRALLDENPDYVMDPLEHPPEVSRYVESLRPAPRPAPPIPPPPPEAIATPWLSLAPGGLYYFSRGDIAPGIAVAASQAALLVTNLALLQQVSDIHGVDTRDPSAVLAYQRLELATNLTAGAFYLSLLLPPAVEFSRWGAQTTLTVAPGAVQVSARF